MSGRDQVINTLTSHKTHVGVISGMWVCACGIHSTNGHILSGDLTTAEERDAEYLEHLADVLMEAIA